MQADAGIDIPSDGEYGKPNFAGYVNVSTHRIRVPTTQTQRAPDLKTGAVTEQSFWSFTKSTTVPAEAYAGRGLCYYYLGQHQKARLDWDRAGSLDTNYRR